jgi:DNA-binding transcriptional LysR family regulator
MNTDYELFVSIVEEGSMSAVARRMNLSRPAVSKRLARLEERLGAKLLHRTTRKLITTREGQSFYEEIAPVIAAAKEAEARFTSRTGKLTGELRIGTVNSLGRILLARMLGPFIQRYPDLRINIIVEDKPLDLLTSRIDVEITFAPPSWQGVVVERLASDRRILCASPDYLARRGVPAHPDELGQHDILASPVSFPWRLKGPDGSFSYHGKTLFITNSGELPGAFAIAGMGIALRPVWAMIDELRSGRLVRILPDYESDHYWSISAAWRADRLPSASLDALIAHLRQAFAGLDQEVDRQLAEIAPAAPPAA